MKKRLIVLWVLAVLVVLPGCSGKNTVTDKKPSAQEDSLASAEVIERIPELLGGVVENNLFHEATSSNGKLLKAETTHTDKENRIVAHRVKMMDAYGNDLAEYACDSDDAYDISAMTATKDGGFLFVLGFTDYAYDLDSWASDKGFASRVIKCDKIGSVQFDIPFDGVEETALEYCFEKNGRFYFFGTTETPETKNRGVYSPTDIYMVILDEKGLVLKTKCIAGSDYDSLHAAELTEHGFLLSISSQSDDGDFEGSNSGGYPKRWAVQVNDDLEITEKKKGKGRSFLDYRLGDKDGAPIYESDGLLDDFDAGTPTAFVDYGDFYLIVSENATGVYENTPPTFNSKWYYTETVYSAYDNSGELVFRDSVDSSPDFDAMLEAFYANVVWYSDPVT